MATVSLSAWRYDGRNRDQCEPLVLLLTQMDLVPSDRAWDQWAVGSALGMGWERLSHNWLGKVPMNRRRPRTDSAFRRSVTAGGEPFILQGPRLEFGDCSLTPFRVNNLLRLHT